MYDRITAYFRAYGEDGQWIGYGYILAVAAIFGCAALAMSLTSTSWPAALGVCGGLFLFWLAVALSFARRNRNPGHGGSPPG